MHFRRPVPWMLLFVVVGTAVTLAADSATPSKAVAAFGAALQQADAAALRRALPNEGKIRVRLRQLGPQSGALSAGQVHAVLSDFLERGSVQSFKLSAIEPSPRLALAIAQVTLVDARGKRADVQLHLSLEPEGDRWVLREIRETSR